VIAYFDSSSIVKWFFDEPYADLTRSVKDETDIAITSILSYPEVLSAFNRAYREDRCSKPDMEFIRDEFLEIWYDFQWIKTSELMVFNTRELIFKHGLRGYDAVHLASALMVREEGDNINLFFSCFDRVLNRAAKKEGLLVHQSFR